MFIPFFHSADIPQVFGKGFHRVFNVKLFTFSGVDGDRQPLHEHLHGSGTVGGGDEKIKKLRVVPEPESGLSVVTLGQVAGPVAPVTVDQNGDLLPVAHHFNG
ncbi:MAG: hypothetical protein EDM75_14695 [Chlorobiota bacterium]|nr:MAG: hypothetical protein EDM75_14695 [Chlorobiota bacterium]